MKDRGHPVIDERARRLLYSMCLRRSQTASFSITSYIMPLRAPRPLPAFSCGTAAIIGRRLMRWLDRRLVAEAAALLTVVNFVGKRD